MKKVVPLFIIGLFFSMTLLIGCTGTTTKDEFGWDNWDVQYEAERQIKERLKSPSTAEFSNVKVSLVNEYSTHNKYKVTGQVDAQNSFGAMIRNDFYIYLECHSSDKYYVGSWDIY